MIQHLKTCLMTAAFIAGSVGMGITPAYAFDIFCPTSLTATWNQAAFGRTNPVNIRSLRLGAGLSSEPTSTLTCTLDVFGFQTIVQNVQVEPNFPAACVAKATFTGQAGTVGVGPFGGFTFKSSKIAATPTYTASTGACKLTVFLRPTLTTVKMSAVCTPIGDFSWRCPDTARQTN